MEREQLVRAIFDEAWNREHYDSVAAALARFRFHIGGRTVDMGLADLRGIVAGWHEGFPDLAFETHTVVFSGDDVAVRATLRGTNTGTWRGSPPTGRAIEVAHAFFFHFAGDLISDVWELLDQGELQRQVDR